MFYVLNYIKKALNLSVNVFGTKVLTGDTFYVSYWSRDHLFTWSSEPREGQAASAQCKGVPLFLSYFMTLSSGPALGIEPGPPALQSSALPTELILPRRLYL